MKIPTEKHENNGHCPRCQEIFDEFPNFHTGLRNWFEVDVQGQDFTAHISCAGRGKEEQNEAFKSGHSLAKYGASAHNYGMAIDIFRMSPGKSMYDKPWFDEFIKHCVLQNNTAPLRSFEITWFGDPSSRFKEMPHCEVTHWWKKPGIELVEPEL